MNLKCINFSAPIFGFLLIAGIVAIGTFIALSVQTCMSDQVFGLVLCILLVVGMVAILSYTGIQKDKEIRNYDFSAVIGISKSDEETYIFEEEDENHIVNKGIKIDSSKDRLSKWTIQVKADITEIKVDEHDYIIAVPHAMVR